MSTFEVNTGAVHRDAEAVGQVGTGVGRVAGDVMGIDPGNPTLPFSAAVVSAHRTWAEKADALQQKATRRSEKLHATAAAYERVEAANEASGRALGDAIGQS